MTIVYGSREARRRFGESIDLVSSGREVAIIERSGKPMVALIPVEQYVQLITEREARFHVLDRIRSKLPELPEDEIEKKVVQVIDILRKQEL